jgi:hypothetical protein
LAVAAYVLFTWPVMTAFLFGPLTVLVAASRPEGRRVWIWLVGLTLWLALWAALPGGLLEGVARAAAALATGVGAIVLMTGSGSVSARALRATAIVAAGTTALAAIVGLRWHDVEMAFGRQWMASERLAEQFLSRGGTAPDAATLESLRAVGDALVQFAPYFPGILALVLFAGLCLAAMLAPRIAGRSVAPAPGPFREFRFNDHLVWLVILGLVGVLFARATPAAGPAASVLAFGVGLYGLRGAAVLATSMARAPRLFVGMLVVGSLFLFPFALGGLTLLGLADTWLDFRRRRPPIPGGLDR